MFSEKFSDKLQLLKAAIQVEVIVSFNIMSWNCFAILWLWTLICAKCYAARVKISVLTCLLCLCKIFVHDV